MVKYRFKNMFLKESFTRSFKVRSSLQTKEGQRRSEFRLVRLENSLSACRMNGFKICHLA